MLRDKERDEERWEKGGEGGRGEEEEKDGRMRRTGGRMKRTQMYEHGLRLRI